MIRCYQCKFFKPNKRGTSGWCKDPKEKPIRTQAVGYCESAEAK